MSLKKWTDEEYYRQFEGGVAPDGFEGLGEYQFIGLDDIVNNFMLTYVGSKKVLSDVGQHEVQFHAQRAIQDFSYIIGRSLVSYEYELVGNLVMPYPRDLVSLVSVYLIGEDGIKRLLRERRESGNPVSPMQTDNGTYIYTEDGSIITNSTTSETQTRYIDGTTDSELQERIDYLGLGAVYNYDAVGQNGLNGRRFGLDTETANLWGTYTVDHNKGLITFDNKASDKLVLIEYITDGLNKDAEDIKIHKFLEEAIYTQILSKIAKGRADVSGADKQMFANDAAVAKKNAKLMLQNTNFQELLFVLQGRSRWIKSL